MATPTTSSRPFPTRAVSHKLPPMTLAPRMFGARLLPSHLKNTSVSGQTATESIAYWIELIRAWAENDPPFFPTLLTSEHLLTLVDLLQDTHAFCEAPDADSYLERLSELLERKGVAYLPLGIRAGPRNQGHGLTCKFLMRGKTVEVLILNLGAGGEMHPFLEKTVAGPKFHFQYFPIHIDHDDLFGERGLDLFARLIHLKHEPQNKFTLPPYSAEDVYSAFKEIGEIQGAFSTPVSDRSEPPQHGMNCGDLATVLLIRDALIDLGYEREAIERFFHNEQLTALHLFYTNVETDTNYDRWVMLRKGIEAFALASAKTPFLSDEERRFCDVETTELLRVASQRCLQLTPRLKETPPLRVSPEALTFPTLDDELTPLATLGGHPTPPTSSPPHPQRYGVPEDANDITDTLKRWANHHSPGPYAHNIHVCRALISLPVPDPDALGYWDQVPREQIVEVLQTLFQLSIKGLETDRMMDKSHVQTVVAASIAYAIADKLARRLPEMCLDGFAMPTYPLEEPLFLPQGETHRAWLAVQHYFGRRQEGAHATLFALDTSEISIRSGLRHLQDAHRKETSSVGQHLLYLQQFLPANASPEAFTGCWIGIGENAPPQGYTFLYRLAYAAHAALFRLPQWPRGNLSTIPFTQSRGTGLTLRYEPGAYWEQYVPFFTKRDEEKSDYKKLRCEAAAYDENGAVCQTVRRSFNVQQWLRLFATKSMIFPSLYQWITLNKSALNDETTQDFIEKAVFEEGRLLQQITDEPQVIDEMRALLIDCIDEYRAKEDEQTTLFVLRIAIAIESFLGEDLEPLETRAIALLDHTSDPTPIYAHLLYLYNLTLPSGEDSATHLIVGQTYLNLHPIRPTHNVPKWVAIAASFVAAKHAHQLEDYHTQPAWIEKTIRFTLEKLVPDALPPDTEPKVVHYPKITWGEYTLDLHGLTVEKAGGERLVRGEGSLVWRQGGVELSRDGNKKWVTDESGDITTWEKRRPVNSEKAWWYCFCGQSGSQKVWHVETSCPTPHHLIGEHTLVTQADSGGWTFERLENGRRTGLFLVDLASLEGASIDEYFYNLGERWSAECWADASGEIQRIELSDHQLTFIRESMSAYRSVQYPNYTLSAAASLHALGNYRGALVLTGNSGERACLLMTKKIHPRDHDFFSHAEASYVSLSPKSSHFFYTLDPTSNRLETPSALGHLYLCYVYSNGRDYMKAIHHLTRGESFDAIIYNKPELIDALFDMWSHGVDHSPQALAFHCHIALFILDNSEQVVLRSYQGRHKKIKNRRPFAKQVAKSYYSYLCAISPDLISEIPSFCRLTPQQELRLLDTIHEEEWNPYFEIRARVLRTDGAHIGIINRSTYKTRLDSYTILPTIDLESEFLIPHPSRPPGLTPPHTPFPEGFVRIDIEQVCTHFITLYERARSGAGGLDLLYILRSCSTPECELFTYAALLDRVGKNPKTFAKLNFTDDPIENQRVFEEIVRKANKKQHALLSAIASVVQTDPHEVIFSHTHTASLSLPIPARLHTPDFSEIAPFPLPPPLLSDFPIQHERQQEHTPFVLNLSFGLSSSDLEEFAPSDLTFSAAGKVQETLSRAAQRKNARDASKVPKAEGVKPETQVLGEMPRRTPAETRLIRELALGHEEIAYSIYTLDGGSTLEEMRETAQEMRQQREERLHMLVEETEKRANTYPSIEARIGLQKKGRHLPNITMDGTLSEAYEKQDLSVIRTANPSLSGETCKKLMRAVIAYHLMRIEISQLRRAAAARTVQGFAEALKRHFTLSPLEAPEVYLFCSRTDLSPRSTQAQLLMWHHENRHHPKMVITASAGSGKTTFVGPCLMGIYREHLPFTVSLPSLYAADREELRASAMEGLGMPIALFESALHAEMTAEDAHWLLDKLHHYAQTHGLNITREMHDALTLKYQIALETRRAELVSPLRQILNLFEEIGVAIVDESRLTMSPFTQSEMGLGPPTQLPARDQEVFIEIYRALTHPDLEAQIGLQQNAQATLPRDAYAGVCRQLCDLLIDAPLFAVPAAHKAGVKEYWLGKSATAVVESRAIDLVHIYIKEFFPLAMGLVGQMRHKRSLNKGEEIHVTARKRDVTTAYFQEVYATLITTIQGYLQHGLDRPQCHKLHNFLVQLHDTEDQTTNTLLQRWMNDTHVSVLDYPPNNSEKQELFYTQIHRSREAILAYLERFVLPQITYCPERMVITPTHFINSVSRTIFLSADSGPKEIYGIHDENGAVFTDRVFAAKVAQTLAAEHNRHIEIYSHFETPHQFVTWLAQRWPADLSMIADIGGALRNFSSKEIAEAFITSPEFRYDGVIFFDERTTKYEISEQKVWLKERDEPLTLKGHDIESALRAHHLEWKDLRLLTLIDPSHGAGANVKQPPEGRALLLLGENLTFGDKKQGALRMRGLFEQQKITLGISNPLAALIENSTGSELNALSVLYWEVKNEAMHASKEVLQAAYHQITCLVEQRARASLKKYSHDAERQIREWKRHRSGFVRPYQWDPLMRFKEPATQDSPRDALTTYAHHLYTNFDYRSSFATLESELEPIIRSVEKWFDTLPSRRSLQLEARAQRHTHQQQTTDQIQTTEHTATLFPADQTPIPHHLRIDTPNLISKLHSRSIPLNTLMDSAHFTGNLHFTHNLIQTKTDTNTLFLKPAQYVLMIIENNTPTAFALSDEEAAHFKTQLLTLTPSTGRRLALLTCFGTIAQNSRNALTHEDLTRPLIRDMITDIGLTQCRLFNPERLLTRLETWPNFWPLWSETIVPAQAITPSPETLHAIERCIPIEHRTTAPKPKPQKKKSWFFW